MLGTYEHYMIQTHHKPDFKNQSSSTSHVLSSTALRIETHKYYQSEEIFLMFIALTLSSTFCKKG